MKLPFIPNAYQGRSVGNESQRFINLYPEISAQGSKSIVALVGTPGLNIFANLPNAVRGWISFNSLVYAVASNKFYSISSSGDVSELGTLATSRGRVAMKHNGLSSAGIGGNQVCMVDGVNGYVYNILDKSLQQIPLTGGFPANPQQIEYIDGYFIVTDGSMNAYASDLFDGMTWNALAKTSVEAAPDNIQIPINLHQQLVFIKEYTTEIYYNNQTPTSQGFPYSRVGGAVIDYGTTSPWAVARGDNGCFFPAYQRTNDEDSCFVGVVFLTGYSQPTVVSTPSITYKISQSTDLSALIGYCYSDEGHTFYVLTDPVDNWTLVFDSSTGLWHERSSSLLNAGGIFRHRSNSYVKAFGKHLVCDYASGRIYEMSSDFYTEAGIPITSIQRTQHLHEDQFLSDIFVEELKIDMETGVGMNGPYRKASAIAKIADGSVSEVVITDHGADYIDVTGSYRYVMYANGSVVQYNDYSPMIEGPLESATVLLQSVDGNGTGATATAQVKDGMVKTITVVNGGAGYTMPPKVVIIGQPVIPFAALSWSKDGGNTYSNEHPKSIGKTGEYRKKLTWRGLGRSSDRVFQLRISSPCKRVIYGYYVDGAT